jgi:hypothetical protein
MQANLFTANNSEGALQAQQDIYAEGWEAARDRVTAAAEAIYDALLNDEFFIDALGNIEKIIGFVDHLIDNLGGLKGVMAALGAIMTKVFSAQISQGITNMAYNIKMMTKAGQEAEEQSRRQFVEDAVAMIPKDKYNATDVEKAEQESMRSQLTLQQELMSNAERMSAAEMEVNKMLLDRNKIMQEQIVLAAKKKEQADNDVDKSKFQLQTRLATGFKNDPDSQREQLKALNEEIRKIRESASTALDISDLFEKFNAGPRKGKAELEQLKQSIIGLKVSDPSIKQLIQEFEKVDLTADNAEQEVKQLAAQIKALNKESVSTIKDTIIPESNGEGKKISAEIDELVASIEKQAVAEKNRSKAVEEGAKTQKAASDSIREARGAQREWSDILVESANFAFSAASAISMLSGAFTTLKDPDVSGWQKFLTILTTLGMVVPTIVSLFKTFKKLLSEETVAKLANVAATIAQVVAEKRLSGAKKQSSDGTKKNIKSTWKDTKEKLGDAWNKGAVEKKYGGEATKMKNGSYSVKGHKALYLVKKLVWKLQKDWVKPLEELL